MAILFTRFQALAGRQGSCLERAPLALVAGQGLKKTGSLYFTMLCYLRSQVAHVIPSTHLHTSTHKVRCWCTWEWYVFKIYLGDLLLVFSSGNELAKHYLCYLSPETPHRDYLCYLWPHGLTSNNYYLKYACSHTWQMFELFGFRTCENHWFFFYPYDQISIHSVRTLPLKVLKEMLPTKNSFLSVIKWL